MIRHRQPQPRLEIPRPRVFGRSFVAARRPLGVFGRSSGAARRPLPWVTPVLIRPHHLQELRRLPLSEKQIKPAAVDAAHLHRPTEQHIVHPRPRPQHHTRTHQLGHDVHQTPAPRRPPEDRDLRVGEPAPKPQRIGPTRLAHHSPGPGPSSSAPVDIVVKHSQSLRTSPDETAATRHVRLAVRQHQYPTTGGDAPTSRNKGSQPISGLRVWVQSKGRPARLFCR